MDHCTGAQHGKGTKGSRFCSVLPLPFFVCATIAISANGEIAVLEHVGSKMLALPPASLVQHNTWGSVGVRGARLVIISYSLPHAIHICSKVMASLYCTISFYELHLLHMLGSCAVANTAEMALECPSVFPPTLGLSYEYFNWHVDKVFLLKGKKIS